MTRLRVLTIVGVLVAGSLVLACSSDKKDDDGSQPTATTSSGSGETPSAGETPSDAETPSGGDAQAELDQLASEFATKDAKIAYEYTSTGEAALEGAFTIYWKPPGAWRMDLATDSGDVTLVSSGGKSYVCSEGQCFESPAATALPLPFLTYFTDPSALTGAIDSAIAGVNVDRSSESIAGQDATCYAFSGGATGSGQYCFGSDGVLLRLKTSFGGSDFTLEATTVEGTVTDADVQPPYPITSLGG